ncbi:MAG TPA: putative toxin-antitoxin system toxin component, PIN family [Anaerolineae bacterium]|nr:putative toxin-antitoxin system toxin component, PIN family [Anaerolineae bacterium]
MIKAVVDLTEMIRLSMQPVSRSPLMQKWEAGAFIWITSPNLIAEFQWVTSRPRLARRIRPLVRDALVDALWKRAVLVTPASEFPHCRDPKDDVVIATAVAANAGFIVTTDRDLYDDPGLVARLRDGWSIQVALPAEFLAALG